MRKVVSLIAGAGVIGYLLNQLRRPSKAVGRLFLKNMNQRHSAVTDWGLRQVQIGEQRAIIDIGCGGGRTLAKLAARAPTARIVGVDLAAGSVAESRVYNAALIAAGRVEVIEASVSQLPIPDGQFDLATAVETHYYWPDLVANLAEIRRVLRSGAPLVLIAETYRDMRLGWVVALTMAPLRASVLTVEEHLRRLADAGFNDIRVTTDRGRGWICVVARGP